MQALRKWNVLGEALCLCGVFRGVYFHRGWNFWLLLMIPWSRCVPGAASACFGFGGTSQSIQNNKDKCVEQKGVTALHTSARLGLLSTPRVGAVPLLPSAPSWAPWPLCLLVFLVLT